MTQRVVAVVVTHDRRELLAEALAAIAAQSRPPDAVVVVDNASTDGAGELVRERFGATDLVRLDRNAGGAGGFAAGLARGLELGADLLWLMDDDTVPAPDALAALLAVRAELPVTLAASRVVWTDGRDHPMNTPRPRPFASRAARAAAASAGCVPIRSASFVSVLVDAVAVRESGPPIADYFLWNDDFEFTTRLLRRRSGVLCPASVAVHKTATFGATDADPGPRFFYEVRNKVWLFTRSRGLNPAERVLYAGSTLLRWLRTYARAPDRPALRREFRRGAYAALRRPPRPNAEILAAVGLGGSTDGALSSADARSTDGRGSRHDGDAGFTGGRRRTRRRGARRR